MMIVYINDQLNRWAAWLRTGRTRLGYPSRSAFAAAMPSRGGVPVLPDDEAMAMCRAVAALEPRLQATVDAYYRTMSSCTCEQIAKHLGCSERTVFDRIHTAHLRIMDSLNDIAAGVSVAPYQQREVA